MAERTRLDSLDAMRGVAALAVFTGHASVFIAPIIPKHSELSVDFFFALSGFVLARAYGDKLGRSMSFGQFVAARYVRLMPLYLIGILIAIVSDAATMAGGHGGLSIHGFALAAATALLLLPSPTWGETDAIMPLNPPAWSLFFELVANFVFAGIHRWLSTRMVAAIVGASALAVGWMIHLYGNFEVGFFWSTLPGGFPRVFFSFFVGVLLFRLLPDRQIASHWAWLPLAVLFGMQFLTVSPHWIVPFDVAFIALVSPALIAFGALVQPRAILPFRLLGDISYPLYVLHVPIVALAWRACHIALHSEPQRFAPTGGVILAAGLIVASILLDHHYDRPVRRRLTKLVQRRQLVPPVAEPPAPMPAF